MIEDDHFTIGDKLPWTHEAVLAILDVAPGGSPKEKQETRIRKRAINVYTNAVSLTWQKAFGSEHVLERKTISKKLRKGLQSYYDEVTCNNSKDNLSLRERIKKWCASENVHCLLNLLKQNSDPETFAEAERLFFISQSSISRYGYISKDVDPACEAVVELTEPMEISNDDDNESVVSIDDHRDIDYIDDEVPDEKPQEQEVLRATRSRAYITNTLKDVHAKPIIRGKRKCTDKIKATCSKVSYECGISAEKARKAVQIVCQELYSHTYYLTLEEKKLAQGISASVEKEKMNNSVNDIDYEDYNDILPSNKAICHYKSLQATQEEIHAAVELATKTVSENVTFHYDTTSRNAIDGEWPSLILNFSTGERFNLRPVYFAYEDKENISNLVKETYERLAVAASMKLRRIITAAELWERTNNLMTDSVSKNIGIGNLVAEKLSSTHIPHHLLCNAHVVEMFDSTNLQVLAGIEKQLKLRERLEKINPLLHPFFRGKAAIVVAGMYALLKLVAHDKSGNTTSLAEEFDHLLEKEGLYKHMALYHERRFTNLGYSAASILYALPQLRRLLAETWKTNLLVEACKLYVDCELFVTELHLLALFTKKITLPYLNCLEKSSQSNLLEIFPTLYDDLLKHDMTTLSNFEVEYRHVVVSEEINESEKVILERMCESAAKGLEQQRGREYGFGSEHPNRATAELHLLPAHEVDAITVVHNLLCERRLGTFGQRSVVAKFRNRTFTAKGIRDDLVLVASGQACVEEATRRIYKILKLKETNWTSEQQELRRQRIQKKIAEAENHSNFTKKLLQACKTWGGPVTTPNELENVIKKHVNIIEKVVKTELWYYIKTHECKRRANPELFKLLIPHDERLENLLVLLGDNDNIATSESSSVLDLPTVAELAGKLGTTVETNIRSCINVNEMCIVVWLTNGEPTWYVGCITGISNDNAYMIEHLERINSQDEFWKYGSEKAEKVIEEQIINLKVKGEWEIEQISTTRTCTKYHLLNAQEINNAFKKMVE